MPVFTRALRVQILQAYSLKGFSSIPDIKYSLFKACDLVSHYEHEAQDQRLFLGGEDVEMSESSLQETLQEAIENLMEEIYRRTDSLNDFIKGLRYFEKQQFIYEDMRHYYYNLRSRYILRSFGKHLATLLSFPTIPQHDQAAKDLTLHQMLPQGLKETFFAKAMQFMMRQEVGSILTRSKVKAVVFMTLCIEQNTKWARKLNKEMQRCYEENQEQELLTMQSFESEGNIIEKIFVKAGADAEAAHDFLLDVAHKKEKKKRKIARDIQAKIN